MKPGKPTTFASINRANGSRCFFFGLPGNPVSCLVTCALMVSPAVKILKGVPLSQCLHTQIQAKLVGSDLKLDPERVEYHRYFIVGLFIIDYLCCEISDVAPFCL
jgi:molybdopterin biosynthesis enzyme